MDIYMFHSFLSYYLFLSYCRPSFQMVFYWFMGFFSRFTSNLYSRTSEFTLFSLIHTFFLKYYFLKLYSFILICFIVLSHSHFYFIYFLFLPFLHFFIYFFLRLYVFGLNQSLSNSY